MIFGSDNEAGASPQVLAAVAEAFRSNNSAYGNDSYSVAAEAALQEMFETDLKAFFVVSGTAANTLALSTIAKPWEGTVCHHQAHILLDESTGPALFSGGGALLPAPTRELKLDVPAIEHMLAKIPNDPPHNIRPAALSLSQASECGQVYSPGEVTELCEFARGSNLKVHMDGARFANAIAHLGCAPAEVSSHAGVDVLTLGATKNGALAAEAILFFDPTLATDFDFQVKRTGHLISKGRVFGAQFIPWLADGHWLDLAAHANAMAQSLRSIIKSSPHMRLAFETQSNETFVVMPRGQFDSLIAAGATMYDWYLDALPPGTELDDGEVLARLVTSFATPQSEIDQFAEMVSG